MPFFQNSSTNKLLKTSNNEEFLKNQMEIPVYHKGDKLSETNNDLKPVSFLLQTIFKVSTYKVFSSPNKSSNDNSIFSFIY